MDVVRTFRGAAPLSLLGAVMATGALSMAGCGGATAIRPKTAPASTAVTKVPDFTLPSSLGGELAFAEVMQKSATVLVFYRGFW